MAVDTGTVYVEIRVALDKLQGDITKMDSMFTNLGAKLDKQNNQTATKMQATAEMVNNAFENMSKIGVNKFTGMAAGINKAFMTLPIIGLITVITAAIGKMVSGIGQFLNKTADAYHRQQKELTSLESVVQITGASAWTSSKQLEQMAQSLSKSTGVATNDIMAMQTKLLTYANIIGDNFNKVQKVAVDMASVMGMDVTSAAELMGRALDSPMEGLSALTRQGFRFTGEIKEQVAALTEQGRISEAQALILQEVENAYKGTAAAQENATGSSQRLQNAKEELNAALGKNTSAWTEWINKIKLGIVESRLFDLRQKQTGEEAEINSKKMKKFADTVDELKVALENADSAEMETLKNQLENAQNALDIFKNDSVRIMTEFADATTNHENIMKDVNYQWQLFNNSNDYIDKVEYAEYYNKLLAEHKLKMDLLIAPARERLRLATKEKEELEFRQSMGELIIEQTRKQAADTKKLETYTNAVKNAEKKRLEAIELASIALANNRIDQDEYNKRTQAAYTEEANQLTTIRINIRELNMESAQGLRRQANDIDNINALLGTSISLENEYKKKIEASADARTREVAASKANDIMAEQYQELRLLRATQKNDLKTIEEIEWQIALAKLQQSDYYANLTTGLKKGTKEYEEALLLQYALEQSLKEMLDAQKQNISAQEKFKKVMQEVVQYGQGAAQTLGAAFGLASAVRERTLKEDIDTLTKAKNEAMERLQEKHDREIEMMEERKEKEKEIFNERFENLMEDINRRMEAELYAAGLIKAKTEEDAEMELEKAKASLDQKAVLQAQNNLKRMQIEKKYAAEQKAMEEKRALEQKAIDDRRDAEKTALDIKQKEEAGQRELEYQKEKTNLEYNAALASWQMQLANALSSAALAIAQAAINIWPFPAIPMVALATSTGSLAVSTVAVNKPKLPAFKDGGIVPGSMIAGDNILGRLNSKERILTTDQQDTLGDFLEGNYEGQQNRVTQLTVNVQMDYQTVATGVAEVINDGLVTIVANRGVR